MASGDAPVLATLMEQGTYVPDCVSVFPSVTPVCAASITTGVGPDRHLIPGMNWYHRGEGRYVEYGTSFVASRSFGIVRSLTDTIYHLNLAHLSSEVSTVFEDLDDGAFRTAGTTYLIYRGRHRHEANKRTALSRFAATTIFGHATYGPRELFYADLFASRATNCRAQLGMPGMRDQHSGCVGAYLVEEDLFDFLLLSLPDNDTYSHRRGPLQQPPAIAAADRQLQRLVDAAGGMEAFLQRYSVIVCSDHAQSLITNRIDLPEYFDNWRILQPNDRVPEEAEVALCPSARAAMIYALGREREHMQRRALAAAQEVEGVDLVVWRDDKWANVWSYRGQLRFAPAGKLQDLAGRKWKVEGDWEVLALERDGKQIFSSEYPNALERLWSAVCCPTAGEILLSAAEGFEFADWGGGAHIGGGSHGSLGKSDSLATLIMCGVKNVPQREQWTLPDIAKLVTGHFGVK